MDSLSVTEKTLMQAIVGLFDAAPSSVLLDGFKGNLARGESLESMVENWVASPEYTSLYPLILSDVDYASSFVRNLLGDSVDIATLALGESFILEKINAGSSRGAAALEGIQALSSVAVSDSTFGKAKQRLDNKVDIATHYAMNNSSGQESFTELRAVTTNVDATLESVYNQKTRLDENVTSSFYKLTVGDDHLVGSNVDDGFLATVFNDVMSMQASDTLDGKFGDDTLSVQVFGTQSEAIKITAKNIENVQFQAEAEQTNAAVSSLALERVDASNMLGVKQFASIGSSTHFDIRNIQTPSHLATIAFHDSNENVNFSAYFDGVSSPKDFSGFQAISIEILDLESVANMGTELQNNSYTGVALQLGDNIIKIEDEGVAPKTYADFVSALNYSLQKQGIESLSATLGGGFKKLNPNDNVVYTGTEILLNYEGEETLAFVNYLVSEEESIGNAIYASNKKVLFDDGYTQTQIVFDNVGKGAQGGDFFIAAEPTETVLASAIQKLNIRVEESSWLNSVATTGNRLQQIVVSNGDGYSGSLRIGSSDGSDGLNDVRSVDANAMLGDVVLQASLGLDELSLTQKYNGLGGIKTEIDQAFEYKTGSGNDSVALSVSELASSYDDFELSVVTGGGDDLVELTIKNNTAELNSDWNEDQAKLKNLSVNTGEGNDTVKSIGDGSVLIQTGKGNDTVYSDNSGLTNERDNEPATWLFNSLNADVSALQGGGANNKFFLINGKLKVTFSGSGTIDSKAFENGFESVINLDLNHSVGNQSDINSAIKKAISDGSVLSKLLVVKDASNGALIIESLVDGAFSENDLTISITQDEYTGFIEENVLNDYRNFVGSETVQYSDEIHSANLTQAKSSGAGYDGSSVLGEINSIKKTGFVSNEHSVGSVIDSGAGDDVVVLSTNDSSKETVHFSGNDLGKVSIVNFAVSGSGGDILDFSEYLVTKQFSADVVNNEKTVKVTVNSSNKADVNSVTVLDFIESSNVGNANTFDALTSDDLLSALNIIGFSGYGNLTLHSLDAVEHSSTLVGDESHYVVMIHNEANKGEYKAFHLTSNKQDQLNASNDHFSSAALIGVIDLGSDLSFTDANFA